MASSSPSFIAASSSWLIECRGREPSRSRRKKPSTPGSAVRARRCTKRSRSNTPDPVLLPCRSRALSSCQSPAAGDPTWPPGPPLLGLRWRTGAFPPWKWLVLVPNCLQPGTGAA